MITRTQLPVPEFRSPKLIACATRVAAQRHCGHIIFVESTAVQAWMREVLVQFGIPRERIAVLNASVKPAERVRIAREFNGLPPEPPQSVEGCALRGGSITELAPKYDVVIANSVAYEGIDLQVRTCTIHHLDLPWTPSDLEQRNGRAHRQGNRMDTIGILYYMSKRSMDGYRFGLIHGKANWLGAVLESGNRDTNNPAAQQNLSADQILLMISRDPEETARRIAAVQAEAAAEERLRVAREAARLMQQANARFRDARAPVEPEKAAQLRADGMVRLRQLRKYDAEAWPWARWIDEVERVEFLVPPDGEAPVFEGLRVAIPDEYRPDAIRYYEFGRLIASQGPPCIGVRTSRSARWLCKNLEAVKGLKLRPEHMPGGSVPWDAEDETSTAAAVDEWLTKWSQDTPVSWEDLGWTSAGDVWLGRYWPRAEPRVRETLAVQADPQTVPVLVDGALSLREGPEVRGGVLMPPTLAGWQQFLALAPASGATFTELKETGELWWARRIPQDLLAAARDKVATPPAADSPSPEVSSPQAAQGHVYFVGGRWFGDTPMLNVAQPLRHLGMGDFAATLPRGTVTFSRYSDDPLLPKQEGRLHSLTHSAGDAALDAWVGALIKSGQVEHGGTWPAFPTESAPPGPAADAEPSIAHLYQIEGETYADEPILGLLKVHSTSKVDYAVGSLTLAWFRREDPLPEQTGRLYQLRHDEGVQGFAVMVDALLESGALKFIGGWPSWDVVGDEPTYAHFRVGLRGPSALLPPGLESIL